ncbi:GWxTD domain-containing protein [bacterium]|nr:GWxTD domain-containing protein [bacterium]RQV94090.1 MAG: GWxTD domain-containing protein [bacterium]
MSSMKKSIALAFYITYLFIISPTKILSQDTADEKWWQPVYEIGLAQLEQGHLAEAELTFESILDQDDRCAEAYVGLGMVYDRENPGSIKARKTLEKAISLNSDLTEAYYQLALVYEHTGTGLLQAQEYLRETVKRDSSHIRAWVKRAQNAEALGFPNSFEAVHYYAEAVKHNIDDPELYAQMIDAFYWYSQQKEGIEILLKLIEKNPDNPDCFYDLARLYYTNEDYDKSLMILDSLRTAFPNVSTCRLDDLFAKNLFAMNRTDEALRYYYTAISAIQDSVDANTFFQDICYIMNNEEYDSYVNTPIDSMGDFFFQFWQKRDPNLATEENERIAEHYRRLDYAYKEYHRYKTGRTANDFMQEVDHVVAIATRVGVRVGDDFIKPYLPKAVPEKRYFDDMGLIYIRHGQPDKQVFTIPEGFGPQNITWQYYPRYNHPELVFHFSKYGASRGWTIESMPYDVGNREEIDPLYWRLQIAMDRAGRDVRGAIFDMSDIGEILIEKNEDYAEIGVKTETSEYEYEEKPLDFPFEWITFRGSEGKSLVELYYGLEGKNIKVKTDEQENVLSLSRFVGLYDKNWQEEARINREDKIPVGISPEEWKESSATKMEPILIPAGETHFEVHLRDNVSDKLGVYKGTFTVDDYWQDSLMLSDILLSDPITPAESGSAFQKYDLAYTPHMFNGFERNAVIGLYYELYNLTLDNQAKTRFQIEWTLRPEGLDESGEDSRGFFARLFSGKIESVSTSYQYEGENPDEPLYLNIDLRDKKSGRYELEVTAKDLNSGNAVSKFVQFEIR